MSFFTILLKISCRGHICTYDKKIPYDRSSPFAQSGRSSAILLTRGGTTDQTLLQVPTSIHHDYCTSMRRPRSHCIQQHRHNLIHSLHYVEKYMSNRPCIIDVSAQGCEQEALLLGAAQIDSLISMTLASTTPQILRQSNDSFLLRNTFLKKCHSKVNACHEHDCPASAGCVARLITAQ